MDAYKGDEDGFKGLLWEKMKSLKGELKEFIREEENEVTRVTDELAKAVEKTASKNRKAFSEGLTGRSVYKIGQKIGLKSAGEMKEEAFDAFEALNVDVLVSDIAKIEKSLVEYKAYDKAAGEMAHKGNVASGRNYLDGISMDALGSMGLKHSLMLPSEASKSTTQQANGQAKASLGTILIAEEEASEKIESRLRKSLGKELGAAEGLLNQIKKDVNGKVDQKGGGHCE